MYHDEMSSASYGTHATIAAALVAVISGNSGVAIAATWNAV
jgi:uncharacterized protein (DUF2062 family)